MEGKVVEVTPAIEVRVDFMPDGGRAFSMRFAPLPSDTEREELDELFDRVLDAVERQRARFVLVDKEAQYAELVAIIRKAEGSIVLVEEQARLRWEGEGRKGEWTPDKLPPTEAMRRDNTRVGLQRDRATAEALEAEITKLRARVNGHGSNGSSDRYAGMSGG